MPEVADTAIKICSRASILIGGDAIQSFTDGTTESDVAASIYEDIARSSLTNTRWRFATTQVQLSRLTDIPASRYSAAYQLPADFLMINSLTVNDNIIEYDTYTNKAFSNAVETDVVMADYVFRVGEEHWPAYFVLAVELSLASLFAVSIARDAQLSNAMEARAEMQMRKARTLDSQQQTSRKLNTSRFISQRRS
tara:strand:+ start:1402 stop:1986 length:585 start_codon:yes stop_codon:yes gene_type:complete